MVQIKLMIPQISGMKAVEKLSRDPQEGQNFCTLIFLMHRHHNVHKIQHRNLDKKITIHCNLIYQ